MEGLSREQIDARIAKNVAVMFNSITIPFVLNLGIGIPTQVAAYIANENICIHAENGIVGVGPPATGDEVHPLLINAGRQPVKETPGCCYVDSCDSFGMIRGGHVDATVLGAFEVDKDGNVSNWIVPNGNQLGVGGAMDLVVGANRVIIAMTHTNRGKMPKLVRRCTLPVTGYGEVDVVVTEMGIFFFQDNRVILKKIAPDTDVETLRRLTELEFEVAQPLEQMLP